MTNPTRTPRRPTDDADGRPRRRATVRSPARAPRPSAATRT
ncbi:hypothetical protein ACFQHN_12260 [Natrialbaceae archaeon GCM10025896]